MNEYSLLEKIGQIAGIGGLALGIFLLIFREVLRKNIFPSLNRQQAYNIIKLVLILTFLIAIFGITAWLWSETIKNGKDSETTTSINEQGSYRRIYYQGFDLTPDESELNQMWLKGDSGDWSGRFADGLHTLCNISKSASASFTSTFRYIKPGGVEADLGNAKVTLRVKVLPPGDKHSSVGILFRKGDNKPDYYAYVLNSGNSVSLMQRRGSGLKIVWSKEISNPPAGSVKLSLHGNGSGIRMYVNDEMAGEIKDADLIHGNPGIFAYSKGCFVFDDFSLYQPVE